MHITGLFSRKKTEFRLKIDRNDEKKVHLKKTKMNLKHFRNKADHKTTYT